MNARKALAAAGAKVETLTKHRVYVFGTTGAGVTLAANTDKYLSLLVCDDDPDYDLVSNNTTIAECQVGSKIVSIELFLVYKAAAAIMHEIAIYRDRDGSFSTMTPDTQAFNVADYSATVDQVRSNIIGYRPIYLTSNADARPMRLPISKSALRRNQTMHDNDSLKLFIRNNAGSSATWWIQGHINTVV